MRLRAKELIGAYILAADNYTLLKCRHKIYISQHSLYTDKNVN
jgi:hypothetical protein